MDKNEKSEKNTIVSSIEKAKSKTIENKNKAKTTKNGKSLENKDKISLKYKFGENEKSFLELRSLDTSFVDWQLYTLLRRLGLKKYEIIAYIALVVNGSQTISQLTGMVSKTGIPQPRAYDILGSLIKYGLVEEQATSKNGNTKRGSYKAKTFRAITPKVGLVTYMNFFNEAKDHALEKLTILEKQENRSYGGVWDIPKNNIVNTAKRIVTEAEHEVLIVADVKFVNKLKKTLKKIQEENSIKISIVLRQESKNSVSIQNWSSYMTIRERMLFLTPYVLVDRKYALMWHKDIFLERVSTSSTGQLIENTEIVMTLIDNFFVIYWRTAKSITDEFNSELNRIYPLSCCNIQSVIEEIEFLKKQNKEVIVTVEGTILKTGEKVSFTGKVTKTLKNWEMKISTIFMDVDGKLITVGGMKTVNEDIGADVIKINTI